MPGHSRRLMSCCFGLVLLLACEPVVSPTVSPEVDAVTPAPTQAATDVSIISATPSPSPPVTPGRKANADVLHVRAVEGPGGGWTFHVTVRHPDTGWDDYADGWDVVTPDAAVLKPDPGSPFTRSLLHPHVDEQPFTRSQSGIRMPAGMTQVRVRAHDLVDGWGGREVLVDLTAPSGPGFEVERNP